MELVEGISFASEDDMAIFIQELNETLSPCGKEGVVATNSTILVKVKPESSR